jgi:hypothetical protein
MNSVSTQARSQEIRQSFTGLVSFSLLLVGGQSVLAYTHAGNTFTTDGSFADTQAAVYAAHKGCVVQIPAGNFTWGHKRDRLYLTSAITLEGQGTNNTTITLPHDSQDYYGNGVITFAAPATVKNLHITATNSAATAFACGANGWRISGVLCDAAGGAYFVQTTGYGLIDRCTFVGYGGSDEMIFCRGPGDSWQTADTLGTTKAVVVEDCLFAGSGYVCDANANARMVVRFCTITGPIKIDGHGKASDTPARGVRQMEVYGNLWTNTKHYWTTVELRGGTGMVFANQVANDTDTWFILIEYGSIALWPNFAKVYQTPTHYPVDDQIGVGRDPKAAGSDPMYLWNNTGGSGRILPITWKEVPAAAIAQYTNETGRVSSTFTMQDIIQADRDYFSQTSNTFDGSTGVGMGTKAQMLAITATRTQVGFWVTDEASWNTTLPPNTSGQLYTWNGSAWNLKYTPLTYPHPSTIY